MNPIRKKKCIYVEACTKPTYQTNPDKHEKKNNSLEDDLLNGVTECDTKCVAVKMN